MRTLFTLTLRQILGGRKRWLLALFLALPVLLLGLVLAASGFDIPDEEREAVLGIVLYVLYPQSLCVLASLLYGAALLAGEVEDKTLVYLFTRALPRWKVLVGKYLATAAVLAALTLVSLTVAFLITALPGGPRLWAALAASTGGACFVYTALFALLGLLVPRRAIPVGLMYAVLVEFLLSSVPAVVNELTASFYLRSLAARLAGVELPRELREVLDLASPATAALALGGITAVALALASAVVHRRQWPLTEGV